MIRLVCWLLGHRRGAELFRYRQGTREAAQSPATRGPTVFVPAGYECARCGRRIEGAAA